MSFPTFQASRKRHSVSGLIAPLFITLLCSAALVNGGCSGDNSAGDRGGADASADAGPTRNRDASEAAGATASGGASSTGTGGFPSHDSGNADGSRVPVDGGSPASTGGRGANAGGSGGSTSPMRADGSAVSTQTDGSADAEVGVADAAPAAGSLAVFIMLDRSGSTVTGSTNPTGPSWATEVSAVTAFIRDPRAAGLDVGLGLFPVGPENGYDCYTGRDCGTPVVPIASLSTNAARIVDALVPQAPASFPPALTPMECALRGMINECLSFRSKSASSERCVAVLVSDGTATACEYDEPFLTQIVAAGHASGVETFALYLNGATLEALDGYASAGGTGKAIDVSSGPEPFIQVLDAIRAQGTGHSGCQRCPPAPSGGYVTCDGACGFDCLSGYQKHGKACDADGTGDGGSCRATDCPTCSVALGGAPCCTADGRCGCPTIPGVPTTCQ
jgi:hypothetical protein